MEELNVYLAGACRGLPDLGKTWRKECATTAKDFNDIFAGTYKLNLYDPTEYFERDGSNSKSNRQVKNFYLKYLIHNCDVVLVNLNDTQYSCGTAQELQYAVDHEIPVIGFGKNNVFEWFPVDCDVVFDTMDEALDYIIDYMF